MQLIPHRQLPAWSPKHTGGSWVAGYNQVLEEATAWHSGERLWVRVEVSGQPQRQEAERALDTG